MHTTCWQPQILEANDRFLSPLLDKILLVFLGYSLGFQMSSLYREKNVNEPCQIAVH